MQTQVEENLSEKVQNETEKVGQTRQREILYAFLVSGLAALLYIIYNKLRYGGNHTLISGDLRDQYIPALQAFVRNLWAGKGLRYSWDLFLGMNATAFNATYVGGSAVNLLAVLFPFLETDTVILIMYVVKIALSGATFSLFCKKVLGAEGKVSVWFGVFYTMCGFQITTCFLNPVWLDALYILPLLLVFIVGFIEERKFLRLILLYAYLFLCNFYMGYIVGFFSALFFLGYLLVCREKKAALTMVQYGLGVILAAGMAAFALVPLAVFILTKNPADATAAGNELVQWDPLLLIQRFFFGLTWSAAERLPYWYCGIPVLLLLPMYFLDRNNEKKEKIFYGILLLVLFISAMILPLYMFWHGFDAPDGWFHRYTFLLTFLGTALACKEVGKLSEWKNGKLLLTTCVEILLFLGVGVYANLRMESNAFTGLLVNGGLMIGWTLFALLLKKGEKKSAEQTMQDIEGETTKQERKETTSFGMWQCVCTVCVIAEVIANAAIQLPGFYSASQRQIWKQESEAVAGLLAQDAGFYRVNLENEKTYNHDTYWGYKGVTDFWSYENYEVRKALENMGAFTSPRLLTSFGTNPFTQLILGIKYNIHLSGAEEQLGAGAYVSPYEKYIGPGFMVQEDICQFTQNTVNAFENDNLLASAMLGENIEIFHAIPAEQIEENGQGILKGQGTDYTYLQAQQFDENDMAAYYYRVAGEEKNMYVAFSGYNTPYIFYQPMLYEYEKPLDSGVFGVRYTKKMTPLDGMNTCAILMQKNYTGEYVQYKEEQIYEADPVAFETFYEKLAENPLQLSAYDNTSLQGKVFVSSKDQILFTSIPYDSGWHVKGDGAEIVPLLDGAFLGVRFAQEGEQDLYLTYEAPGQKAGMIISVLSVAAYCVLLLVNRKKLYHSLS